MIDEFDWLIDWTASAEERAECDSEKMLAYKILKHDEIN